MPLGQPRLFAVLGCIALVAGQQCGVEYTSDISKPLLFGGVSTGCVSGCAPRDSTDDWAGVCAFNSSSSVWGICTPEQFQHSFAYAQTLGAGSILRLSPCDLVPYLRGRTLWLLGDSHSKTFYRALQCFLFDFWAPHQECTVSADPADVAALLQQPAAEGHSNCFHLTGDGGGRVCMVHTVLVNNLVNNTQIAEGGVLPYLRARLAQPDDIFYISIGSWHRKTADWGQAYKPALETVGQYYNTSKAEWPHLLWREMPALHPANTTTNTCTPLTGYEYQPQSGRIVLSEAAKNDTLMQWVNGGTLNRIARDTLSKYNIPVIAAFNISAPLVDNHVGMRGVPALDCLHYCSPGVPEMWIWYLYSAMIQGVAGIKPLPIIAAASSSSSSGATTTRDLATTRLDLTRTAATTSATGQQQQQQQLGEGQYVCNPSSLRFRH